MEVAHLRAEHPGGIHRGHPGGDIPALMAADIVEGQRGTVLVHRPDLAVGHQSQLDQGLEAVADAQHQAIPVFEQVVDRVGEAGITDVYKRQWIDRRAAEGTVTHLAMEAEFDRLLMERDDLVSLGRSYLPPMPSGEVLSLIHI